MASLSFMVPRPGTSTLVSRGIESFALWPPPTRMSCIESERLGPVVLPPGSLVLAERWSDPRISTVAGATIGAFSVPGTASAQADSLTANAAVVTDYRFRGISQSFKRPALQGGADFAHKSGAYIGTWASTVDKDFLADTKGLEIDLYGGYKFPLGAGWTGDVGILQYLYPGESLWNTTELYFGGSWEWFSAKYSYSIGNKTFGFLDSRGSGYLELNAT